MPPGMLCKRFLPRGGGPEAADRTVNLDIGEIDDNAVTRLRGHILHAYSFDPGDQHVWDAIKNLGLEHQFQDPDVLDAIESKLDELAGRMDRLERRKAAEQALLALEDERSSACTQHQTTMTT
jgi:hypothetical protein